RATLGAFPRMRTGRFIGTLLAATCGNRPPASLPFEEGSIRCRPQRGEGGLDSTRPCRPLDGDADHPLEEGLGPGEARLRIRSLQVQRDVASLALDAGLGQPLDDGVSVRTVPGEYQDKLYRNV